MRTSLSNTRSDLFWTSLRTFLHNGFFKPKFQSLVVLCALLPSNMNNWICCFFWWPEVLIFSWNNYLAGVLKFHKGGKNLMTFFFFSLWSTANCSDLNETFKIHDYVSQQLSRSCVLLNLIKTLHGQCWTLRANYFRWKQLLFERFERQKSLRTLFCLKINLDNFLIISERFFNSIFTLKFIEFNRLLFQKLKTLFDCF